MTTRNSKVFSVPDPRGRVLLIVVALLVMLSTVPSTLLADDDGLAALIQVLAEVDDPAVQTDVLLGMREGLKGRKQAPLPKAWPAVYARLAKSPKDSVRYHARALAITFGDPAALAEVKAVALSAKKSPAERNEALEILIARQPSDLAETLLPLLDDAAVRGVALRGLAVCSDAKIPSAIIARYASLASDEKQDALVTLATRKESAALLLNAIEKNMIPRGHVSSYLARQLHAFRDEKLSARVKAVWGDVRESPQDTQDKIARLTKQLTAKELAAADLPAGRRVFQKTCQQCHTLFGEGKKIGPDLTGANRTNLEYVLTNIVDPSAAIAREYKMQIVVTLDGRVLTGIVVEQAGDRLTLQTVNERVVLTRDAIEEQQESAVSMMPEGQVDQLTAAELRDLVAYLASKEQVPLEK